MRILTLDGGGAKGFYTLGVLEEVEAVVGAPLSSAFDLIYGTSTGSIIGALLALGRSVNDIRTLYESQVLTVVKAKSAGHKSSALRALAEEVFGKADFRDFVTGVGIVATRWIDEKPMIFKNEAGRAAGRKATFVPGFGCHIADAIEASCSAYPFFERKVIRTSAGDVVEIIDGGYCANNPALYAIADALGPVGTQLEEVKLLSVGVGNYPEPRRSFAYKAVHNLLPVRLLQKTLEINTNSMAQLTAVLFPGLNAVRVSDTFSEPHMATDLFESNLKKLNLLRQKGAESFGAQEAAITSILE
jgi:patatin-like phospholipase/acyl hydrolase